MPFTAKTVIEHNEKDYYSSDLSDIISSSNYNEKDYDSSDLSDIFNYDESCIDLDTEMSISSYDNNIHDINNKQYRNFINEDNKSVIFSILKKDINKNNYPSLNNPYIDVLDDENFLDYYRPSKNTIYEKYKCLYEKHEHSYLNTLKSVSGKLYYDHQKTSSHQSIDNKFSILKDFRDKELSIFKNFWDDESSVINDFWNKFDLIGNDYFNLHNKEIIDLDFSCITEPITLEEQINLPLNDNAINKNIDISCVGLLFSTPKNHSQKSMFFDPLNDNSHNVYHKVIKKRKNYKKKYLKYKKLLLKIRYNSYSNNNI